MKILIIEDEQATAIRLTKLLREIELGIEVLAVLDSIEASINWFRNNPEPDLILLDIELADGSSFEIFKKVNIESPIIFTTAYNQYAINAFKLNSVDYLLKPVKKSELINSLNKFKKIFALKVKMELDYEILAQMITKNDFQKRIIVRYGNKIKVIDIDDIAYFYTEYGNNYFRTFENQTYPLDLSLDKLESMLNPEKFYRINRQFYIQYGSIKEMYSYSKSRVKIILKPECDQETIASTDRSSDFKKWLAGK